MFKEPVPPGMYTATFLGVEDTTHDQYGDGLTWRFKILGGAHDGQEVSRITPPQASNGNATGKMLKGLIGARNLTKDNMPDVDQLKGKSFAICVQPTKTGDSTRVESVTPPADPPPF
jgi:hypothetical protein